MGHLGAEGGLRGSDGKWRRDGCFEGVALRGADEAEGSRAAFDSQVFVFAAVHVANSFSHMVAVIANGYLRRVTAAALVYSLELSGSLSGLGKATTLG